jgi:virulence factor
LTKLRIALIGLGDIAQKAYLPVVANHAEITPVLSTRNPSVLAEIQKRYRINETYTDLNDLITASPDAVMIHSNTASHFTLAKRCIEAGIATFVDKPLSFSIDECQQLISLAKEYDVPFYVGFNRRFAPLLADIENKTHDKKGINHVRWQKNRVGLPASPRSFVYNDFIHLVDGLRFFAQIPPNEILKNLQINHVLQKGLLAHVQVQFQHNNAIFEASMNRVSGITEERLEVFLADEKIQIDSLTQGTHYKNGQQLPLGFNDWQSHLTTRGFNDMMDDWLTEIKTSKANHQRLDDILASHQLCETIVQAIEQNI